MNSFSPIDDSSSWEPIDPEGTPSTLSAVDSSEPSWVREPPPQPTPGPKPPRSERKLQYKGVEGRRSAAAVEEDCCCVPQDPIKYVFYVYHMASSILSLLNLGFCMGMIATRSLEARDAAMYFYGFLFSIILVGVELDFKPIASRVSLLDLWLFRGLLYAFVGIVSTTTSEPEKRIIFLPIVGFLLIVVGIGYFLMYETNDYICQGMCCIKTRLLHSSPSAVTSPANSSQHGDYDFIPDFSDTPTRA